jgi:hypothetical protein
VLPRITPEEQITPQFSAWSPERIEAYCQQATFQRSVTHAPCITFHQFQQVAKAHGWTEEFLIEYARPHLDRPTDIIRRVLEGARVEGHRQGESWVPPHSDDMAEVVLPYRCLIDLYQRATRPTPALAGEKVCRCGCGGALRGRQTFASVACRKRVSRKGVMGQKLGTESATDAA